MTEAFIVKSNYVLSKWNATIFNQDISNIEKPKFERYVDTLKVFYLNPEKCLEKRKEIKEQFFLSDIPENQIERVEPTKYPCVADNTLKNNILSWDHINMWQKAFDQNCDGALFFEDDVYFLKNWKQLLQDIFDKFGRNNTHIIRFDPAPLISIQDLPHDKIAVFRPQCWACTGGYYMSKDAIITSLNIVKTKPWTWNTIEYLIANIIKEYFENMSYETSPRICIQNWFLGNKSSLQKESHMKRLKNVMCCGYLQRYYERYNFNKDVKNKLKEIFKEYEVYNYKEKIIS